MENKDTMQDTSKSNRIFYKEKYSSETSITGTIKSIHTPIRIIITEVDEIKERNEGIGKEYTDYLECRKSESKRSRSSASEKIETNNTEKRSMKKRKVEKTNEEVYKKRKNCNEIEHSAIGINVTIEKKKKERVLHGKSMKECKIKKTVKKLKKVYLKKKETPITRKNSLKQKIVRLRHKPAYLTLPQYYGRMKSIDDMDDCTEKKRKPKSTGRERKIKKEKEPTSREIEKIKKEVIVKKEISNEKHKEDIIGNEEKIKSIKKTVRVKKEICKEQKIKKEIGPASANILENKEVKPKEKKIKIQRIGVRKSKRIEEIQKKKEEASIDKVEVKKYK